MSTQESKGYTISKQTFMFDEDFVYKKDIIITTAILSTTNKEDSFNNYPFKTSVKLNGQSVTKYAFKKVFIYPKKSDNPAMSSVQLGVFVKTYPESFIELIDDIERSMSKTVEAYNATDPELQIQPYYSSFDFESPQFKQRVANFSKKPGNKGKEYKKFDTGLDVQVYFHKETKLFNMAVKNIENGVATYITSSEPLTREALMLYKSHQATIVKNGFDIFRIVYKKTLDQLLRLTDDQISQFNDLLTETTFVDSIRKYRGLIVLAYIADIKSNFTRPYSSWKLSLGSLAVEPSPDRTMDAFTEVDDLLGEYLTVSKTEGMVDISVEADEDIF